MSTESDVSEVLAIFDEMRNAMLENDLETLQRHVAEDYSGCDAGGLNHGRETYLEAYGPGGVELEVFEVREVETTTWEKTVLIRGAAVIRGSYGEHDFEHDLRFLDVYAQRGQGYQLVASHVCDILPQA